MPVPCRSLVKPGTLPLTFTPHIEPPSGSVWARASYESRKKFWLNAARIAMEVKQRELAAGLDHAGRRLRAVKPRRLKYKSGKRLDGEPLMPHRAMSRTRRLLRYIVHQTSITFYWASGWGKILDYHRRGAMLVRGGKCVGRLPVRNVFGISPAGRREVARRAKEAWLSGVVVAKHDLMRPGGVSAPIPFDPALLRPVTAADWRKLGLNVNQVNVTSSVANPETGIPGQRTKDDGLAIVIDWSRKPRKRRP